MGLFGANKKEEASSRKLFGEASPTSTACPAAADPPASTGKLAYAYDVSALAG